MGRTDRYRSGRTKEQVMRNIAIGVLIGLVLATFAPRAAQLARNGFDTGRDLAGAAVQHTGEAARP